MPKRRFYIKESEMDDFQRNVIKRKSDSSLIVTGCAGSGKSVLAFWTLHDIVINNKGTVQVIVFTKALKDFFIEGCKEEGINPENVDYWYHWKTHKRTTDYVIVDEAQDFSKEDIECFKKHATESLLLYGDSAQQIYKFLELKNEPARVSMDEIKLFTNYPMEILVFNHRLPKLIAELAEYVIPEKDEIAIRCKNEGIEKPYILKCDSFDDQMDLIAQTIEARSYEDVGILLPKNEDISRVSDELKKRGLRVESKTDNNLNFTSTNPKIMSFHSAKGLQFEAVFIPNCEETNLNGFDAPLYVAMTRTYETLYVLYSDILPKALRDAPEDLYETSLIVRKTELL